MSQYPHWADLPELDLYLDQVLLYVNQAASTALLPNDKGLTAAMVNNYVKHGHVDKPIKKKYGRNQIARLIAITTLKNVFSIQDISRMLEILRKNSDSETLYNAFVACMMGEETKEVPPIIVSACQTLARYQATQTLISQLTEDSHDHTNA